MGRSKGAGLMVSEAIGDAYGGSFEYASRTFITENNDLAKYYQHPSHAGVYPGRYTDDTQQSIGIAELLVEGVELNKLNIANKLVEVFWRDPRVGYSRGMYSLLSGSRSGEEFLKKIDPTGDTSGAAMRAAPIGVLPNVKDVIEKSEFQASVTHNSVGGKMAAAAASLLTHYMIYDLGPKKDVGEFINFHLKPPREVNPLNWDLPYTIEVRSKGWMSVRAAITAVKRWDSMSDILKASIAVGGDVDTVAILALAAGSQSREVEQDLPQVLIDTLENETYGRDYLAKLNDQLMALKAAA